MYCEIVLNSSVGLICLLFCPKVTMYMESLHMYCEIVLNSSVGLICLLFCPKVSCGHS